MSGAARNAKYDTLVCFAVKEEARLFQKFATEKPNVSILVTGIGRKNAEKAVREFLTTKSPDMILTCGFAGGLNPDFKVGTVVFSTDNEDLRESLLKSAARNAKIICAERIAITVAEKENLRRNTNADAVEMESDVIQFICRERGIPCATVRVISDAADEDLPLDFNRLSKPDMNLDYGKLLWAIVKSPGKIHGLMKLRKNCQFAAEQLSQILAKIILHRSKS
jgi:adenosylhomocysteine nucleosidase